MASCNSYSYFQFILSIAKENFNVSINTLNDQERTMCVMLHYDVWQDAGGFDSLDESIQAIGRNTILTQEIIEVLEILIDKADFIEKEIGLLYTQPLKVHGRYTKDQILCAFKKSTFACEFPSMSLRPFSLMIRSPRLTFCLPAGELG